jgi:hypothetical protein
METGLTSFAIFLGILWFLVYWILGGVFFAIITILKLGRVRKVRFSCLFSLLALICGFSASYFGLQYASDAISTCTLQAVTRSESIISIFGCGFAGIFGAFLIGAFILVAVGSLIVLISQTKTKPWLEINTEGESGEEEGVSIPGDNQSKYF